MLYNYKKYATQDQQQQKIPSFESKTFFLSKQSDHWWNPTLPKYLVNDEKYYENSYLFCD